MAGAAVVAALCFTVGCPEAPQASPGLGANIPGTPSPSASPGISASLSPTPSPTPSGRFARSVAVSPSTASISVAPPRGATPANPYTVQLSATVSYNDGTQEADVVWQSGEGDRALVSEAGLVSAGIETGPVRIFAISRDGRAFGYATVTVKAETGIEVGVD